MKKLWLLLSFTFLVFANTFAQEYISFYNGTNWPDGTTSANNLRSDPDRQEFTSYTGCVYADVAISNTGPWGAAPPTTPRYSNCGATYGFGMELNVDWNNCTSSATMTITFKSSNGGPITEYPVSFSVLGLNSHICGVSAGQRFIDRVTVQGYRSDLTTAVNPAIAPSVFC